MIVRCTGIVTAAPPPAGVAVIVVSYRPGAIMTGVAVAFTAIGAAPAASPFVTSSESHGAPLATVKLTMLPYTSPFETETTRGGKASSPC